MRRHASSARRRQWLGYRELMTWAWSVNTLHHREVPRSNCSMNSGTELVGIFLPRLCAVSENLISFCNVEHDPLAIWIGQLIHHGARFHSELSPVLCHIDVFRWHRRRPRRNLWRERLA